jgi:hypothetical protein
MKKSLALIVVLLLVVVSPASAHILKNDGTIGAELHIEPDDNPRTGLATKYNLEFSDTAQQFTLSTCTCRVALQLNGKTIYSEPLHATGTLASQNSVTFTHPAIYTIQVIGRPQHTQAFQPFTLTYLVPVDSGTAANQSFPVLLELGIAMAIGLVLLAIYKRAYKKQ